MFPLRDHNPSERVPYVTFALIAVNVAVFVATWPLLSQPHALRLFYADWALVPAWAAENPVSFLSSMFLHGSVMHLGGNMLFLWIFGDNMEDEMGHTGFLAFYLASGLGAAVLQIAADPASLAPMVGASGAIAGVMGGYLLMFPKARVDILIILIVFFRILPIPAWIMLALWFGMQLIGGVGAGTAGGIAYWAHVGGFVAGLLLALPLWQRRGGAAFWSRTEGHPPHPGARYRIARTRIPTVRRRR